MKKYKKKIAVTIMIIILILNTIMPNKYNIVKAIETEEKSNKIEEITSLYKTSLEGKLHFVQEFSTNFENEVSISISNFPDGTRILDSNNNEINILKEKMFKIAIPEKNIFQDISGIININEEVYKYDKEVNKSTVIVKTISKDGRIRKTVNVELMKGEDIVGTAISDDKGECKFNNLYPGRYKAYEKDANGNIHSEGIMTFDLLYMETKNVILMRDIQTNLNITVENEKKKGTIEITAVDVANSERPLENIEIEIYNSEEQVVETLTTNKEGIAISSRLPIDNIYKVKQKTVPEEYNMDISIKTVKFNDNNEKVVLKFENSMKTNFIKITKVDKDNNNIKLEGVVFGIYNEDNELIEEITTDSNGEAISSNLPINKTYNIREIKTLDNYVLDDKTITIILKEDNIETESIETKKISSRKNFLLIENQRLYDLLPKLGC